MIDLTPLDPFCCATLPAPLRAFSGRAVACGRRGPVEFIYTVDHDGQVELSLARPGEARKPTDAMVAAFFRFLGAEPYCEASDPESPVRHFLMVPGRVQ